MVLRTSGFAPWHRRGGGKLIIACLLVLAWCILTASSSTDRAFFSTKRRTLNEVTSLTGLRSVQDEDGGRKPVLLDMRDSVITFTEPKVDLTSSRILAILDAEVTSWWQQEVSMEWSVTTPLTGPAFILFKIYAPSPQIIRGQKVDGIEFEFVLPDSPRPVEALKCTQKQLLVKLEPFIGQPVFGIQLRWSTPGAGLRKHTFAGSLLHILLLPWIRLLRHLLQHPDIDPITLIGGVLVIMTMVACLIVLVILLVIIAERHLTICIRRRRRLWKVHVLTRQAKPLESQAIYGVDQPCCICLGDNDSGHDRIVLLPCRHALHKECYMDWVQADVYPSLHLICPLCRHRAEAFGRLEPAAA
mmetsp:Transcript_21885/g.51116  ORF Transcript_21885/g.51116 Transcript_21885/m.51116 type:complete len:358 (-) Transcript_21885:52-1125(-)